MRKILLAIVFLAICPVLLAQQTMNNADVIKMAKAGLSDELILTTIHAQPGTYDVSTDGLIALKAAGISDKVVSAMVVKAAAEAPSAQLAAPPNSNSASDYAGKRLTIKVVSQCPPAHESAGVASYFGVGKRSAEIYSNCTKDLNQIQGWVSSALIDKNVFTSIGSANPDLILTITITQEMFIITPSQVTQQNFSANYQLADTANRVLFSDTVNYQEESDNNAAEQHFAVKVADAISTQIAAKGSAGAGGSTTASPASSAQKPNDIEMQAKALAQANFYDILVQAYRSLAVKPPLPEDALLEERKAKAALKAHDPNAAVLAYLAALKLAPWWPEGMRGVALIAGQGNQPVPAIYWMHMYLKFVPDAKDAPKMEEKVNAWVQQVPPQPHPPTHLQLPPGTHGLVVSNLLCKRSG